MIDPRLAGRTAVVTGAARGIGAALAQRLAECGASVALVGLEPAELEATAAACRRHRAARAWTADVTDGERMGVVAAEAAAHFGRIDLVVANAGVAIGGPFADSDADGFDRVIEVNLLGSVATARALGTEVAHRGVGVGVAYLTWTDTDMIRGADSDEPLRRMRAGLPWPANRTTPLAPAVERLLGGLATRASEVYGQPWIRALQWLPRRALPAFVSRYGRRDMAKLTPLFEATAGQDRRPVGPGGRAAMNRPNIRKYPSSTDPVSAVSQWLALTVRKKKTGGHHVKYIGTRRP